MRNCLVVLMTLAASPAVCAQSVNVDFNDIDGTPASDYAAAGAAGAWNAFTTDPGVPTPLLGLDGLATTITLSHDGNGFQRESSQTTTGNDSALLRDYLFSVGPAFTLDFEGLLSGTYDVFTYAYFREDFGTSTDIWVNGDTGTTQEVIGRFENGFVEGMSHARHRVQVLDGLLSVTLDNDSDPLVNGIQLVLVPGPSGLALSLGLMGRRRRRRVP